MRDFEAEWATWMRASLQGDGAAYARLLHEFAPVLRRIVRSRARALPDHSHEDIVQDTLLAIHRKRHTWDPARPLRPWIFAVARHKVADAFRARGSAVQVDIDDWESALAAPDVDPTASTDATRLLARLDHRSAEIVRAIHLRDESPAEVGPRLAMTEGAVRVALHRAMKRLATMALGSSQ